MLTSSISLDKKSLTIKQHYENLIENLRENKNAPIPAALLEKIQLKYLKTIFEYLLETLNYPWVKNEILKLFPGNHYKFVKSDTFLARSITIVFNEEGFKVYLETKSKDAQNNKIKGLPSREGVSKKGKTSWRIDIFEESINLISRLDVKKMSDKNRKTEFIKFAKKLEREVQLSHQFSDKLVCHTILGGCQYDNKNGEIKFSIYAQMAYSDLREFIEYDREKLTSSQVQIFIYFLLHILVEIHRQDIAIQDLSPDNLLVYKHENFYSLKFTDFGLSYRDGGPKYFPLAKERYASPELFCFSKNHPENYIKYPLHRELNINAFTRKLYELNKEQMDLKKENFGIIDKANDLYAAGLIIYELLFLGYPIPNPEILNTLNSHALLSKLLTPKDSRCNANEALEIFSQELDFSNLSSFEGFIPAYKKSCQKKPEQTIDRKSTAENRPKNSLI